MYSSGQFQNKDSECRQAQSLLSDYIDNTLSARQVLDIEKHLTDCPECATRARDLRTTVNLLQRSERFDTDDDFMAKLHARLDGLEPEATRARLSVAAIRDWLAGMRVSLRAARVPALSLGVAATALFAAFIFQRASEPAVSGTGTPAPVSEMPIAAQTLHRNVALAASNPFEDPVAANLAAHAALKENSAGPETTP
jgi:anti-sigma factor RsiW